MIKLRSVFCRIQWGERCHSPNGSATKKKLFRIRPLVTETLVTHIESSLDVNTDGGNPLALQITFKTATLHGTAGHGGSSGSGTIFALNTGAASKRCIASRQSRNIGLTVTDLARSV
jgi:uncharacterized repeat protein (TIGR03803 family)